MFDLIIGNPPYQEMTSKDGSQATPLYGDFILKSIEMRPKAISMITPSRWLFGGFGLADFRERMFEEERIAELHDFISPRQCFPSVDIAGGVSYFLWEKSHKGKCRIHTYGIADLPPVSSMRRLDYRGRFVRFPQAFSILEKTSSVKNFNLLIGGRDPFGLGCFRPDDLKGLSREPFGDSARMYFRGWKKDPPLYVDRSRIATNLPYVDRFCVFVGRAYGHSKYPYKVINTPFLGEPGSCCDNTFNLVKTPKGTQDETESVMSYMRTKLFRFLVACLKQTQHASSKEYQFVPLVKFDHIWSDEELYDKFGIVKKEVDFINKIVK